MDDAARARIDSLVASHDITLFMKGNREQPQCGFSATVIRILDTLVPDYRTHDVLSDPALRDDIKTYSSWPTVPQLYVKGDFVGGCDIVQELFESGELAQTLGVEVQSGSMPTVTITEAAAARLRDAVEEQGGPGRDLHLSIDARFQSNLFIGPTGPGEIAIEQHGVRILMDPVTAARAEGITMDMVETDQGAGFQIDNPNAPKVHPMDVAALKARLDSGKPFELLDVRTDTEIATASIPGAVQMTEEQARRLEGLPRDSEIVFHCHHGGRSQQAAEHFTALGFTNVHNVVGGIDAWSQQIDPGVPRY